MALPSSGSISLNQMHTEVGGTSGTTVSLNDSDIRGLISKASGATMSFSEWYGASAVSDWSATLTVGTTTAFKVSYFGYGLILTTSFGSLSDTTVDNYSNTPTVANFYYSATYGTYLSLTNPTYGTAVPNSGWSTLTIGSTSLSRTNATYNSNTDVSWWTWSTTYGNPFGTSSGATRSISMS